MKSTNVGATITLWVGRLVALVVAGLIFALPAILDWYTGFRFMTEGELRFITVAFYICAVIIAVALWNMDTLLRAIIRGDVFTRKNVTRIRRIRLCCGLVALVCLAACFAYLPLVFLVFIMAFLCLAVSVVASVMDAAVSIREENDLTI